jgi:hypothetical protein
MSGEQMGTLRRPSAIPPFTQADRIPDSIIAESLIPIPESQA